MMAGIRGLFWLFSAVGLGSWIGGDTVENQTIIKQATVGEKVFWVILLCALIGFIIFGIWWLFFRKKKGGKK